MDWIGIAADLIKTVIGAGLLFLIGTFFWRQPKIAVEYRSRSRGSHGGRSGDYLLCFWNGHLRLYNPTPYDAFDLRLELSRSSNLLRLEELAQKHLKATEVLELRLDVQRELPKDEVVEARSTHRESELEPTELRCLKLRLS